MCLYWPTGCSPGRGTQLSTRCGPRSWLMAGQCPFGEKLRRVVRELKGSCRSLNRLRDLRRVRRCLSRISSLRWLFNYSALFHEILFAGRGQSKDGHHGFAECGTGLRSLYSLEGCARSEERLNPITHWLRIFAPCDLLSLCRERRG